MVGAAKVIEVGTYERIVDTYGDVPYFEAVGGMEGLTNPVYDDAQEIYEDFVVQLDSAVWYLNEAIAGFVDIDEGFPDGAVTMNLGYQDGVSGKLNLLYQSYYKNYQGNETSGHTQYGLNVFLQHLYEEGDDPRVAMCFIPGKYSDDYSHGLQLGINGAPEDHYGGVAGEACLIGEGIAGGPTDDSQVMSEPEIKFLMAEAVARGYTLPDVSGTAQDYLMTTDAPAFRLQSRFIGSVEFCAAPSHTISDSVLKPFTFNIKGGYKFKYTSVSGILGIEYLNGENFIPVGIEVRQNFSNKKWVPFAYTQAGYSLHLKRNIHSRYFTANYAQYEPSFYLRTGIGYCMATTLSEFYLSLGYLYHELEEIVVEQTGEVRTDLTTHGVALSIGFVF